jgi:hypothetical protein
MRSSSRSWTRSSNNASVRALAVSFSLLAGCAPSSSAPRSPKPAVEQKSAAPSADRPQGITTALGARINLIIDPVWVEIGGEPVFDWVTRAAQAVEGYYGRFPLDGVDVRLFRSEGRGIGGGRVVMRPEPHIVIGLSPRVAPAHFAADWRLTHEMVHLALPSLADEHHWLEEGLATYVEPIARTRSGWLREELVWREWIENMPQGLPQAGDRGLDRTATWGRTYWGGALFCLLADIEAHERTHNQRELAHALRAILEQGNIRQSWRIERLLATGDRALGGPVLQELYEKMRHDPAPVDLDVLWAKLGVALGDEGITYDDNAPLAATRRVLVAGLAN